MNNTRLSPPLLIENHIVPVGIKDIRLSDYCTNIFKQIPSRKGMKKAIDRGEVFVNGKSESTAKFIQSGDLIELMDLQNIPPKPYTLEIPVVFEDEYMAIVNKPAGLVTSGNLFKTLQNCLEANLQVSPQEDALKFPQVVHRLDAPTSGLVMVAKTAKTLIRLSKLFAERKIEKTYQAVVIGKPLAKGVIETPLEGKASLTHFFTVRIVDSLRNTHLSLLDLSPQTGRTHQLRKHLSGIGHPIFGDKLYGREGEIYQGKGLFLAAVALRFVHPILGKKVLISIETPKKFTSLLAREQRRWEKYNGVPRQ